MLRPFALIIFFLLVSFTFILQTELLLENWEDHEARWKSVHKAVCLKRSKYGKCKGHREMWYFDMYKMICLQFTYSNCGGNMNRFFTKKECDDFCTANSNDWVKQKY